MPISQNEAVNTPVLRLQVFDQNNIEVAQNSARLIYKKVENIVSRS